MLKLFHAEAVSCSLSATCVTNTPHETAWALKLIAVRLWAVVGGSDKAMKSRYFISRVTIGQLVRSESRQGGWDNTNIVSWSKIVIETGGL